MTAVHQFVATFEPGAIGNEMLEAQRIFRNAGYASEIFTEHAKGHFADKAYMYTEYGKSRPAHEDDILIYHMAIGSVVADWLKDRTETLVLRHHNITPVEYYAPWPGANTYGMAWGRNQLRELANRTTLGLAASEFNRQELEALRYRRSTTAPVLFDYASFATSQTRIASQKRDWLFVGWIAPHKCQHDVIRAFALYRRLYDPLARLHLVGRTGLESYETACKALAAELGLSAKPEPAVIFHGRVDDDALGGLYRDAAALVCMSEHEGVGLPLLEAMQNELPIVAFRAAAVPETVGNSGIVLSRKHPAFVAAAVNRLVTDCGLRETLIARGKTNLANFSLDVGKQRFLDVIRELVAERSL